MVALLNENIMPSLRDSGFWLIEYSYHNAIPTGFLALLWLKLVIFGSNFYKGRITGVTSSHPVIIPHSQYISTKIFREPDV
jgi:hypothetical protein